MFVKEQSKINAIWKIQIRDAKTGKLIREQKTSNVVTDNGKALIASYYVGNGHYDKCWVLVLGTGTGSPSSSDTNLWSPVDASEKSGSLTVSGNIAQYYVRYLPEDANGYTYTEGGIYENVNCQANPPKYPTGTLINHVLIDPAIEKTSDILVDIYIQLQFS